MKGFEMKIRINTGTFELFLTRLDALERKLKRTPYKQCFGDFDTLMTYALLNEEMIQVHDRIVAVAKKLKISGMMVQSDFVN